MSEMDRERKYETRERADVIRRHRQENNASARAPQ